MVNQILKLMQLGKKVKSSVYNIRQLPNEVIEQMFSLMPAVYDGLSKEQFRLDLKKKNKVILIHDSSKNRLVGFSTLYLFDEKISSELSQEKRFTGLFSGDTIIDPNYWGGSALQMAFGLFFVSVILSNPFKPLYWFLISKGYKTYLLMANNFGESFPQPDAEIPKSMGNLMNEVYSHLYPDSWNRGTGLIHNTHGEYHIKYGVAAPDEFLVSNNRRVAYFLKRNPGWQDGDELACLAKMKSSDLANYVLKRFRKATGLWSAANEKGKTSYVR